MQLGVGPRQRIDPGSGITHTGCSEAAVCREAAVCHATLEHNTQDVTRVITSS